jgi:hypothetical protein
MDACMITVCVCVRPFYTMGIYWLAMWGRGRGGGERMELMMRKYQQQRRAAGFTSGTRRSSLLLSYTAGKESEGEIPRRN